MKYQLILPHYNGDIVEMIARSERGHKTIVDAPKIWSHFYVEADQIIKPDFAIIHVDRDDYTGINGKNLWKIETKQPTDVSRLRGGYQKHWEADIPFVRRVLIDLGITGAFDSDLKPIKDWSLDPSVLVIDIETLSLSKRSWKADMKSGRLAVAMMALKFINWMGKETNIQFILDPDIEERYKEWSETKYGEPILKIYFKFEAELLRYFWILLKKLWPDVITGWNVKFDTTYPLIRSWVLAKKYTFLREYVGSPEDWDREGEYKTNEEKAKDFYLKGLKVLVFDLMRAYDELYKPQSKKLKRVSKAEGISDREHETGGIFNTLYWEDREEAARYNWDDDWETWEINKKHDIIGFYWENKNFAGMETLALSVKAGNLLDTILLRLAKHEIVLPSRPQIKKKEKGQFPGGLVSKPELGVYYNVATLDASRYYPSIILAYKKLFYPVIVKMVKWVSKGRDVVEELLKEKTPGTTEHRSISLRRDSRKFLLNAVYGTLGDMKFRLANVQMASKITSLCRAGIKAVSKLCESFNMLVIRSDTDSVVVSLELGTKNPLLKDLIKKGKKYVKIINEFLHKFFKTPDSHLISFKMEKIWQPIVSLAEKKMYFGRVIWEDEKTVDRIVVRGLKTRRRDSSTLTNKILSKVYDLVLYRTVDEVLPYIRSEIQKFRNSKFDRVLTEEEKKKEYSIEDIMINIGVGQELHRFKVDALHKRGSEYANDYIYKEDKISGGSRVYLMYCNVINPSQEYPDTDVVAVEDPNELPSGIFKPNYQEMLSRCIEKPLEGIFEAVGLKWEDLTPKKDVKKLFRKKRKKRN